MAKIKREQLVAAAKDLNKVLGLEPPINTNTTKEKELVTALSEVVDLIDETDEIKDSTREVLVQLGFIQSDVEDEVEDDEFEEQEEEEGIEDITPTPPTLEELKDLITDSSSTKELKELMKHELLTEFTPPAKVNVIDLRIAMLDFLEKDEVKEVKEVKDVKDTTEKVEKVKKPVKKEVKEKPEKTLLNTRIACMAHVMLTQSKLSKDEQIKIADKLFCTENAKKTNIKEQSVQWQRVNNVLAVVNSLQSNE